MTEDQVRHRAAWAMMKGLAAASPGKGMTPEDIRNMQSAKMAMQFIIEETEKEVESWKLRHAIDNTTATLAEQAGEVMIKMPPTVDLLSESNGLFLALEPCRHPEDCVEGGDHFTAAFLLPSLDGNVRSFSLNCPIRLAKGPVLEPGDYLDLQVSEVR